MSEVLAWRAAREPRGELGHGLRHAPVFQHHERGGTVGAEEQPILEGFRAWIIAYGLQQELALHGEADRVRRLIALA